MLFHVLECIFVARNMARDIFHFHVKEALVKDGWTITHDQWVLKGLTRKISIDLAAEKILVAERGTDKIAVEVKSFLGLSTLTDLYEALGKYEIYLEVLREKEPDRVLFVAMPITPYEDLVREPFIFNTLQRLDVKIIVFDIYEKVIVKWIL